MNFFCSLLTVQVLELRNSVVFCCFFPHAGSPCRIYVCGDPSQAVRAEETAQFVASDFICSNIISVETEV